MRTVQKKYFAGILAAALALAGCSTTSTGAANAKGIHAVATTTQICDYLTQIANNGMKLVKTDSAGHETTSGDGDVTLNLTCLLAPNASAHEHEMTPQQMKALAQADLLFVNGVDLEHFLDSAYCSVQPMPRQQQLAQGVAMTFAIGQHQAHAPAGTDFPGQLVHDERISVRIQSEIGRAHV